MGAFGKEIPTVGGLFDFSVINDIQSKGFLQVVEDTWHEQGDLFILQLANNKMLIAIHPDHVKYINVTHHDNYIKGATYAASRKYMLGNGLLTAEGDIWRKQRQLIAPFFTPRGIQAYINTMIEDTVALAEDWAAYAQTGQVVDIELEMSRLAASIILHNMFSSETQGEISATKQALETMNEFVSMSQTKLIKLPTWIPTRRNRQYMAAHNLIHGYIDDLISERQKLAEEAYPDDLLSKLLLTRDDVTGERMSHQQVHDEAITFFAAGHETTARALMFAWYMLAQSPKVRDQLHNELDEVIQGDIPTVDELKQLSYTLRTIKETIRMYPPAPSYVRNCIADDTLDGYHVPAGIPVVFSSYLTHRHPDFWVNPENFDPMRFSPENEQTHHPYQYHPFAAGQRICIGNNFSLMECQVIVAILAKRFKLTPIEGYNFEVTLTGTLGVKNGMPMTIEAR